MATYGGTLKIYITCAHADGWQFEMTTWLADLMQGNVTGSKSLHFGAVIVSNLLTNVKTNAC